LEFTVLIIMTAEIIFYVGTLSSAILFLILTFDTHLDHFLLRISAP